MAKTISRPRADTETFSNATSSEAVSSSGSLLTKPAVETPVVVSPSSRPLRAALTGLRDVNGLAAGPATSPASRRPRVAASAQTPKRFSAQISDDQSSNHQAELFYLQKQIQLQTQMVFVLEDGTQVHGVVEWYDRHTIKVRGKNKVLIFKSAIKYLYKAGEIGSAPTPPF